MTPTLYSHHPSLHCLLPFPITSEENAWVKMFILSHLLRSSLCQLCPFSDSRGTWHIYQKTDSRFKVFEENFQHTSIPNHQGGNEVKICPWKPKKSETSNWSQSGIWGRHQHWCIISNIAEESVTQCVKIKAPIDFYDSQLHRKIYFLTWIQRMNKSVTLENK